MAIQTGDILRVADRWKDPFGSDHVNVYYFRVQNRGTETDVELCQAIADWIGAIAYNSTLTQKFAADAEHYDIKIDGVEWDGAKIVITDAYGTYVGTYPYEGEDTSDPLPPGDALVVLFRTTGVKCLGRKFLGMMCEGSHSAGNWTSGLITIVLTWAANLLSSKTFSGGAANSTIRAVIHSKRSNAWLELLSVAVSTYAGYQRRRRQRQGS